MGFKPKKFNSDRGGEYTNAVLKKYFDTEGIEYQFTSPYTPELNGIAERKNRTLVEMTRCMLCDANLPNNFWGEAAMTANYLQNRTITSSTNKTPYELWHGRRPQIKSLAIFGSKCYVQIPKQKRTKLDYVSKEMILLGFDEYNSNIYRCYDSEKKTITISRNVKFITQSKEPDEQDGMDIYFNSKSGEEHPIHDDLPSSPSLSPTTSSESVRDTSSESTQSSSTPSENSTNSGSMTENQDIPRRSTRTTKNVPPRRFGYDKNVHQLNAIVEPRNYEEVLTDKNKDL